MSQLRIRLALGLSIAALLGVWEVLARTDAISSLLFPPPTASAMRLLELTRSGELPRATADTLWRLARGTAIGVAFGTAMGLVLGTSRRARTFADPVVSALHPIPKVSLMPLALVLFGFGDAAHIAVIAISSAFPMIVNVMAGARAIDPLHLQVARHFGMQRWHLARKVVLPGSLPYAVAGLRLAINAAFVITIAMELVFASDGLGGILWKAWEQLRLEDLFAALAVISAVGLSSTALLNLAARRLIPWNVG